MTRNKILQNRPKTQKLQSHVDVKTPTDRLPPLFLFLLGALWVFETAPPRAARSLSLVASCRFLLFLVSGAFFILYSSGPNTSALVCFYFCVPWALGMAVRPFCMAGVLYI
jgi:hypothetical protein